MGVEEGRKGREGESGAFVNDARVNDSSRFSHHSPMTIGARRYRGIAHFDLSGFASRATSREIFSKFINGACPRAATTIEDRRIAGARTRRGRAISKCHSNSRKTRRFEILFSPYFIGEAATMHFYGCIRAT